MSHRVSRWFTGKDLASIQAAVKEAEKLTTGEIVPYVVEHSDHYEDAEWRCGFLLGVVALAIMVFVHDFTLLWLPLKLTEAALVTLLAVGAGMLLARFVPVIKRSFAGRNLIHRRVAQRAAEAFVTEEVFKTRNRTGILIFLSLFERTVLVVGDTGINAKVEQGDWHDVVQRVVQGIRLGKPAEGLIEGIRQSGVLLQKHGLKIRPGDRDELPDSLRMSDD